MLKLVPLIYTAVMEIQLLRLKACEAYALTFDLWTSIAGSKYLVVTYHGINSQFELFKGALDLIPFDCGAYTGFIVSAMKCREEEHCLQDMLLAGVVSDGAANVQAAKNKLAEGDNEDCLNHLLKNMWGDVLEGDAPFDQTAANDLNALGLVVALIRMTPRLRKDLGVMQEREGASPLEVIAANLTRWEGRHNSLNRVAQLKGQLQAMHKRKSFSSIAAQVPADFLSDDYFARLEAYKPVLQCAHVFSKRCQDQAGPSLPCVIMG
jgi:hypothetical protein